MNIEEIKFRAYTDAEIMIYNVMPVSDRVAIELPEGKELWAEFDYMQSIRCIDKNGVGIYEGDIIEWDDQSSGMYWRVAVVELNPDIQFRIIKNERHKLSTEEGRVFRFGSFIYTDTKKHLEVIGNIWEGYEDLFGNKCFYEGLK